MRNQGAYAPAFSRLSGRVRVQNARKPLFFQGCDRLMLEWAGVIASKAGAVIADVRSPSL